MTSDGHKPYLESVESAFGNAVDYAMLVQTYEGNSGKSAPAQPALQPGEVHGRSASEDHGQPGRAAHQHIVRRAPEPHDALVDAPFTRLTDAFSKKLDNHKASVAFYFMGYTFARIHLRPYG